MKSLKLTVYAIAGLAAASASLSPTNAAAFCDSFTADAGNNIIIIGEGLYWHQPTEQYIPYSSRYLDICWRDSGGYWQLRTTNCNALDTQPLLVDGAGGNDQIVVHPSGGAEFVCNNPANAIAPAPWGSYIDYGVELRGGDGVDIMYGSPMDDVLISNNTSHTADSDQDTMCGYAGTDLIEGDQDSGSTNYDCMHGGAGSGDDCDSIDADSPDYDRYASTCESHDAGSSSNLYWCCDGFFCGFYCWHICEYQCPAAAPDLSP